MNQLTQMFRRVASEAVPPVEYCRVPMGDYFLHLLLDDLVQSESWLDRDLKEWFLEGWVNDELDPDDPIDETAYDNLHKFAAMEPVVDLESLKEQGTTAA